MTQLLDIKEISARYTAAREKFEDIYGQYHEQEKLVNNMLITREQLEEESSSLSENWLNTLIGAAGIQTEETGKISVMAGMAKENLDRIIPAIEEARLKLLDLCYESASAGVDYKGKHNALSEAVINPLREDLINEIQDKVTLLHGLNLLSSLPAYETESVLSEVVTKVKKSNSKPDALEYLHKAADDNETLKLYPGNIPPEVATVIHLSPSPAQMAVARNAPQKKKALAEGIEKCKGFEGY
ncbi:hypothetical protein DQ811_23055 [Salmonella enterica subsp. diarizonae]|uniref:Uncharacterized protein n=1 Tax=Salmonella diarizonae TaxID=59204 RepID=A0A6Y5LQ41_SALDZ|nr:hypothetical protein [Salmonella enterica]ECI4699207.1 hypothetical protein [Salmonella enterica subsp. diarizonae]EGK6859583.1 hypothetical protein [Salmonella enterica subsp. enterica serovar Glostrup]ECJ2513132.1 hypothetical protein [Salmonella enterica subsp. diarizonae]EIF6673067.1 hypothetical protein [Salmonella enterica]